MAEDRRACRPGEQKSAVVSTADYESIEGGARKSISLVDAIRPLVEQIPPPAPLVLSSHPITTPWPLATHSGAKAGGSSTEVGKKRQRKDDAIARQLQELDSVLKHDVGAALAQLQAAYAPQQWLSVTEAERVIISSSNVRRRVSWPVQEELKHKNGERTGDSWSVEGPVQCEEPSEVIHRLVATTARGAMIKGMLESVSITMPPQSAFLLTDVLKSQKELPRGWEQLADFARQHPPHLVLLDPPYPNYSAERLQARRERYEPVTDLYELWNMVRPVGQLLECAHDPGLLVGCWVTNHAKAQRFVLTKLFPAWGLHHVGQLVWIKVTAGDASKSIPGGQLVFPLDNRQGRKPYEVLLLGQRGKHTSAPVETHLFASVPLGHSRKPPVLDLLRPLLRTQPAQDVNVFELFARSLFLGPTSNGYWVSIGNEPIAFNTEDVVI